MHARALTLLLGASEMPDNGHPREPLPGLQDSSCRVETPASVSGSLLES